jgi:hypothetical protein
MLHTCNLSTSETEAGGSSQNKTKWGGVVPKTYEEGLIPLGPCLEEIAGSAKILDPSKLDANTTWIGEEGGKVAFWRRE